MVTAGRQHSPKNFPHNALEVGKRVPIVKVHQPFFSSLLINLLLRLGENFWMKEKSENEGL
jgi:hypothetical protein